MGCDHAVRHRAYSVCPQQASGSCSCGEASQWHSVTGRAPCHSTRHANCLNFLKARSASLHWLPLAACSWPDEAPGSCGEQPQFFLCRDDAQQREMFHFRLYSAIAGSRNLAGAVRGIFHDSSAERAALQHTVRSTIGLLRIPLVWHAPCGVQRFWAPLQCMHVQGSDAVQV